jgi:hypothetical protein
MTGYEREDSRLRPVVLQTSAPEPDQRRRRPVRYLGWAGGVAVGVIAAAGLVAGGSAIWSAVDPGSPPQSPLWIQPPPPVGAKPTPTPVASETTTPDDHGGRRATSGSPTSTTTTDDHGGRRGSSGSGKSGSSGSSSSGSDDGLSGKSH